MLVTVENELRPSPQSKVRIACRTVLPWVALAVYVILIGIGEYQIRSSRKWPPPKRHELGAWTVEDPAVSRWAAALNLPATIPIGILYSRSDAFAFSLDEHNLVAYVPWTILVWLVWYFCGYRLDQVSERYRGVRLDEKANHYYVYVGQLVLTLDLVFGYLAGDFSTISLETACFWAWSALVIVAWLDSVFALRSKRPA